MTQQLAEMKGNAPAKQQPKDFPSMLKAFMPEIQRALPAHMSADRMSRIALTEFRKNPKLAECDPRSVFAAVIMSSQLGLEVGIQGQAYLVPYNKNKRVGNGWQKTVECQFIPGWQGLADLVSRSGRASVWTGAVYEGDEFDYQMGDQQYIKHKAGDNHGDPKFLTHVYAVGRIKDAVWPIIEVWTVGRVKKHRDRYNKVGQAHYSFTDDHNFEMYGRKIALLQVIKYMPKSVELQTIMDLDARAEQGKAQNLDLSDAITGNYTVVEDDDDEPPVEEEVPQKQAAPAQEKQAAAQQQASKPAGGGFDDFADEENAFE
jgi:recombination protein RecT